MDIEVAIQLLQALARSIDEHDGGSLAQPSPLERERAKEFAEKEAIRRLLQTESFISALSVGKAAYDLELRRRQRPLSFIHTDGDTISSSNVVRLDR